jgi:hypothetical protein
MGYHVNILRTKDGKKIPFSVSELKQAAESLSGWKFESDKAKASFYMDDNHIVTVWCTKGEIWANNPDEDALAAMIHLADALKARVRGDEFETYRSPQDWYIHDNDKISKSKAEHEGNEIIRRTRRHGWIMHMTIFGIFAVFVLIVSKYSK